MTVRPAGLPEPIVRDPNPGFLRAVLHGAYDLLWSAGIVVASPWWVGRSCIDRPFRRMVLERLTFGLERTIPAAERPRILIHGVSVGEVKAAQPLVALLRAECPQFEIVISTTTDTGVEVAGKLFPDLRVVRFPVDLSFLDARFLRRVRPACVVLMELEIWPNFLREANRAGVPLCVVNGRITQGSFGHYRFFRTTLPQFNRMTLFCAQNERYAQRFIELGRCAERVVVTGNIKADGLQIGAVDPGEELRRIAGPRPGQPTIVAGSTHEPEERLFIEACRAGVPDARVIVVPRHPNRAREVVRDLEALGVRPQLLTRLRSRGEEPDPTRPLIVDTIGELEQIYGLADLVFVGGSLIPHGGQNMLEPAAHEKPVLFGPHVANFRQEAQLLIDAGAGRTVADGEALAAVLRELCADAEARAAMARAGIRAVEAQRGAARVTLQALRERCLES